MVILSIQFRSFRKPSREARQTRIWSWTWIRPSSQITVWPFCGWLRYKCLSTKNSLFWHQQPGFMNAPWPKKLQISHFIRLHVLFSSHRARRQYIPNAIHYWSSVGFCRILAAATEVVHLPNLGMKLKLQEHWK